MGSEKIKKIFWSLCIAAAASIAAYSAFSQFGKSALDPILLAKTESEQLAVVAELHNAKVQYSCVGFDSLGRREKDLNKVRWVVLSLDGEDEILFSPKSMRVSEFLYSDQ